MARIVEGRNHNSDCKKGKRGKSGIIVTLLSTLYKIYIKVLAEKVREEVKVKKIIPHNLSNGV